jgi:hypothetical protein
MQDKHDYCKYFGGNNTSDFVVTSNILTNNFASVVTSGHGPDMARRRAVGPR